MFEPITRLFSTPFSQLTLSDIALGLGEIGLLIVGAILVMFAMAWLSDAFGITSK